MLTAILLSFREGLEAALVVGMVLGALKKMDGTRRQSPVWSGVALAVLLSVGAAALLTEVGIELEGTLENIFEGTMLLIAAIVLTWMIFWMQYQGRRMKGELEEGVRLALTNGTGIGLFSLAFVATVREGIETALLLTANAFNSTATQTLVGTLIGLTLAVGAGWLIFATTVRLNTRQFFKITSAILIVFAAGLVAHGIHEFNEGGFLPGVVDHVWDVNWLIPEDSTVGNILASLVGYVPDPSLTVVLAWLLYFVAVWFGSRRFDQFMRRARQVSPANRTSS